MPVTVPSPSIAAASQGGAVTSAANVAKQKAAALAAHMIKLCPMYAQAVADGWDVPTGFVKASWAAFYAAPVMAEGGGEILVVVSGSPVADAPEADTDAAPEADDSAKARADVAAAVAAEDAAEDRAEDEAEDAAEDAAAAEAERAEKPKPKAKPRRR